MSGDDASWATRSLMVDGQVQARRMRAYTLVVTSRGRAPMHVDVDAQSIRVGSRPENDVVVDDPSVSRLHLEIAAEDAGFRLRDLGSRNGTFVDGYRVKDIYLRDGSVIRAGKSEIAFRLASHEVDIPAGGAARFGPLVGASIAMRELYAVLAKVARADTTLLVEGETGTGKELVARAVHEASARASGPLVTVDCASMPAGLLESLLFGHERGAFTGATDRRMGQLELADGGTLFLDELGELPLELQPKLLRALESRTLRRVGGTEEIPFDVRIVAATNRDLAEEVNRGAFRDDLYYRLAVIRLRVPPLRDRLEDLPMLIDHFVRRRSTSPAEGERMLAAISEDNLRALAQHPWPGNVRELRNVIERSLTLAHPDERLELSPTSPHTTPEDAGFEVDVDKPYGEGKAELVDRFDRKYLFAQLERHGGNISAAARASGLERMHFKRILKKYL